jgi:hypothetical protein
MVVEGVSASRFRRDGIVNGDAIDGEKRVLRTQAMNTLGSKSRETTPGISIVGRGEIKTIKRIFWREALGLVIVCIGTWPDSCDLILSK